MTSAQRLCFVGWADHVHLERWAGHFAQRGDDVSVISMSGPGSYPARVRQCGLGLKGRGPRWTSWRLRYLFWRLRPALVHVHWAHFAPLVRRAWKGPLVVTAWGSDVYRREQFTAQQWSELAETLAATELVTCDSEDLAERIRREFRLARARVQVIQWGVDTDAFHPQGPNLRAQLGLEEREVVYSARNFTPVYNQETVVSAFALLHKSRPAAFLLMKRYGGDPGYLRRIREQIEQQGLTDHVRILDGVPYEQMPDLYRTADVTVSIPHSDAMPMSVLEAMASGSIVVAGNLPSLREWIEDGKTGHLIDPTQPQALADALHRVLDETTSSGQAVRHAARDLVERCASQRMHMGVMGEQYRMLAG